MAIVKSQPARDYFAYCLAIPLLSWGGFIVWCALYVPVPEKETSTTIIRYVGCSKEESVFPDFLQPTNKCRSCCGKETK